MKKRTKYLINTEGIIFKLSGQPEEEEKEQEDKKGVELGLHEEGLKILRARLSMVQQEVLLYIHC